MSRTIACPGCGTQNRLPIVVRGRPRCASCKADLPWIVDVDGSQFDDLVAESSVPVVVDLWAPWCGPCRMVTPMLESLARERAGSLRVVKVNVDEAPNISSQLGVQGIPTIVMFCGGREVSRQVGALPADRLSSWIDDALAERR